MVTVMPPGTGSSAMARAENAKATRRKDQQERTSYPRFAGSGRFLDPNADGRLYEKKFGGNAN
jgi:hypothetical protein